MVRIVGKVQHERFVLRNPLMCTRYAINHKGQSPEAKVLRSTSHNVASHSSLHNVNHLCSNYHAQPLFSISTSLTSSRAFILLTCIFP